MNKINNNVVDSDEDKNLSMTIKKKSNISDQVKKIRWDNLKKAREARKIKIEQKNAKIVKIKNHDDNEYEKSESGWESEEVYYKKKSSIKTNENKNLPTDLMNFLYSSITENDYHINFIETLQ